MICKFLFTDRFSKLRLSESCYLLDLNHYCFSRQLRFDTSILGLQHKYQSFHASKTKKNQTRYPTLQCLLYSSRAPSSKTSLPSCDVLELFPNINLLYLRSLAAPSSSISSRQNHRLYGQANHENGDSNVYNGTKFTTEDKDPYHWSDNWQSQKVDKSQTRLTESGVFQKRALRFLSLQMDHCSHFFLEGPSKSCL